MTVMELSNGFESMEADELYFINGGSSSYSGKYGHGNQSGNVKESVKEPKENKPTFTEKVKEIAEKISEHIDNIHVTVGNDLVGKIEFDIVK